MQVRLLWKWALSDILYVVQVVIVNSKKARPPQKYCMPVGFLWTVSLAADEDG